MQSHCGDASALRTAQASSLTAAEWRLDAAKGSQGGGASKAFRAGAQVGRTGAKIAITSARLSMLPSRIIGGSNGGLSLIAGLAEIVSGMCTLATDHPDHSQAEALLARVLLLKSALQAKMHLDRELQGMLSVLERKATCLQGRLRRYQVAEGASGVGGGLGSVCGGMLALLGAACGGPVTLTIGGAIGTGFGIVNIARTIGCSWRDYGIRGQFWEEATEITEIRRRATKRSLSEPCRLVFKNRDRACQMYMVVQYTAFDGTNMTLMSCDKGYNWYGGSVTLEPDITNLVVSFAVRGGRSVFAVDRNKTTKPWKTFVPAGNENCWYPETCFQETFVFPDPSGLHAEFDLRGTSFHAYVAEAVGRQHGQSFQIVGDEPVSVQIADRQSDEITNEAPWYDACWCTQDAPEKFLLALP